MLFAMPATKRSGRRLVVHRATRAPAQDFLMLLIAPVDPGEVPCASNYLSVALAGARASLKQDKRFDIHRTVGEPGALFDR